MEDKPSVLDNIKGFFKSSEGFACGAFQRSSGSSNQNNPIEILKRLQQEIFTDLMKIRVTQEKIESLLSFKSGKGFPSQETTAQLKVAINVVGALLFVEDDVVQAVGSLDRSGTRTGVNSRFIFETLVRDKDTLVAEFTTGQKSSTHLSGVLGNSLALTTLMYSANVNDWLSVVSSPLGARCTDFIIASNLSQGHNSDGLSLSGPPLFSQHHDCAAGFAFRGSNIAACLAELISGPGMQQAAAGINSSLTTFGQVMYQPVEEVKFTLSGLWKASRSSSWLLKHGTLAIPLGSLRQLMSSEVRQVSPSAMTRRAPESSSVGTIALMLGSEFDQSTKLEGWLQADRSVFGSWQWGISLSDIPENELGWGLRTGGITNGNLNQFNFEGFLDFNLGNGAKLQPAFVCVMEGGRRIPALILRSSWFM
ncbi:uncharacterized protein [Typha angustifolia]|uniref:uncharacterized protein isoform X1 n=1 Tax=Typha angustifolia TaxID=59011 RepID=UPI003C2DF89C